MVLLFPGSWIASTENIVPADLSAHIFEEHTGELRIRLVAPTLDGLFIEAGRALAELTLGSNEFPSAANTEFVSLKSTDRDALLVDWMNELIFHTETTGKVYVKFEFQRLTDKALEALIRGAEPSELRTVAKAATFHGLHIKEDAHGFSCTIVLDI